jgi:hypothetical protein
MADKNISFKKALEAPTYNEAVDILWEERTETMAKWGDKIERQIAKRRKVPIKAIVFLVHTNKYGII